MRSDRAKELKIALVQMKSEKGHVDESFDIVLARHMLYYVTDIEKALLDIKRVLTKDGIFYATTNSSESMAELHELMDHFDSTLGLNN